MNGFSLSELPLGQKGKIQEIKINGAMRRRLLEMGFHAGETVKCMYIAPQGSPIAFLVKGALVALRRNDCRLVSVTQYE